MKKRILKHALISELAYLVTPESKITKIDFKSVLGDKVKNYVVIENGDYVYYLPTQYTVKSPDLPTIYTIENKLKVRVVGLFENSDLKIYEIYWVQADEVIADEDLMERFILCLF